MPIIQTKLVKSTEGLLEWEYVDDNTCQRIHEEYVLLITWSVIEGCGGSHMTYYPSIPQLNLKGDGSYCFEFAEHNMAILLDTHVDSMQKLANSFVRNRNQGFAKRIVTK